MLLTSLAMGRTHPAWDAPPELPAGTMLTDIKRTMLRDLALMHQSQMPTSDSPTSPSRKDPTTSITINAVAARQIEVKREMCVIGRPHRRTPRLREPRGAAKYAQCRPSDRHPYRLQNGTEDLNDVHGESLPDINLSPEPYPTTLQCQHALVGYPF